MHVQRGRQPLPHRRSRPDRQRDPGKPDRAQPLPRGHPDGPDLRSDGSGQHGRQFGRRHAAMLRDDHALDRVFAVTGSGVARRAGRRPCGGRATPERWPYDARAVAVRRPWNSRTTAGPRPDGSRTTAGLRPERDRTSARSHSVRPSPCTYSAGGSPSRAGGLDRTVSVIPGSPTARSRSPSATLTVATFGATEVASADGSSVEDMRQCYETITRWIVCSQSQPPPRRPRDRVASRSRLSYAS